MSDSVKKSTSGKKASSGFSAEEKAAMKERAKEMKASSNKAEAEADALAKIAELPEPERNIAERLHTLIKANAPSLSPKTWYGMPAYANSDGKIVCFYQSAQKFGTRYGTLGFNDSARLDDGDFWPVAFALKELTPAIEAKIAAIVKKAVS
ncbi:MAG: DUF1801 domain-containing protein [Anaerolineae bacterium]|nr:DUF1801 domain-containing protein [Anaerolineae bacterium]